MAETVDHAPNLAEDNINAPQNEEPPLAMEGYDRKPEAMPVTVHNEDDTSDVTHIKTLQESAVCDKVDDEGEAVRDGEEVAEGQTSVPRRTKGGENHPAKREEADNYKDKHGWGKGWLESATAPLEDGVHATTPPSTPKRSQKLKVERHEERPHARRRSRTRTTIHASL